MSKKKIRNIKGRMDAVSGEILDRAILGDKLALDALLRAYEGVVYKFAFRVCRQRERAEETVQETFVNVIRKLPQFDRRSSFTTWLYAVVTNNCLMQRRKAEKDERVTSLDAPSTSEAAVSVQTEIYSDHAVLNTELKQRLDQAIQSLPMEYRVVFVLRDLEELSTEEAAEVLGLSVAAVKSRLRRARLFLRDQLAEYVEGRV
jgi:RNA polymerase sigma-70 factor, ECF subfamily